MKKIILTILFLVISSFAWEVNTHRAFTKTALDKNPENLKYFVDKFEFSEIDYKDEKFDKVATGVWGSPINTSKTLFEYINNVESLSGECTEKKSEKCKYGEWKIQFDPKKADYETLVEAGSVLEDADYRYTAILI